MKTNIFKINIFSIALLGVNIFGFHDVLKASQNQKLGSLVDKIQFTYDGRKKFWGDSIVKKTYGDILCEAHVITSVSTRIITNFQDLEFYCKEKSKPLYLSFESINKPNTPLIHTKIQNYKGRLLSIYDSRQEYDFIKKKWVRLKDDIYNPDLVYLMPNESGWVRVLSNSMDCKLNLKFEFLYNREKDFCAKVKRASSLLSWDSKIFINENGGIKWFDISDFKGGGSNSIDKKEKEGFIDGFEWSYFLVPSISKKDYIFGGSGWKENLIVFSKRFNKNIFKKDKLIVNTPNLEWYSVIKVNDKLYFGGYPSGLIFEYGGENLNISNVDTDNSSYALNHKNEPYREVQSLLLSSGTVFSGMYPWGEINTFDQILKTQSSYRLFTKPKLRKSEIHAPFFDKYHIDNEWKTFMSQRVPTLVVLDGKVCGSTGNFNTVKPEQEYLDKYEINFVDEYGQVHCSLLPNQKLVSNVTKRINFEIFLYENGFTLNFQDTSNKDFKKESQTVFFKGLKLSK